MNVALIDVDSHNFPNLALMKISAYHKAKGDQVEWWNSFKQYDIAYKAKVFSQEYTNDEETVILADKIIQGGTGYDLKNKLPDEIEHIYPDYSIYNITNKAYGFLTRGCPRGCAFCIVGEKEGLKSRQVADLSEFWRGQKEIILLDPNLTAAPNSVELLKKLAESKAKIDFTQGIDIRCMTEEKVYWLNKIKTSMIHFAWDNYEFSTYEMLKKFRPMFKQTGRNLSVYVLTNFNTNYEQDLERIYKLRELDYTPYVMIFNKPTAPKLTVEMSRWVNNRFIWRSCERFEDYNKKELTDKCIELAR